MRNSFEHVISNNTPSNRKGHFQDFILRKNRPAHSLKQAIISNRAKSTNHSFVEDMCLNNKSSREIVYESNGIVDKN